MSVGEPLHHARQASEQKSLIIGRRLCGHVAAFGLLFTFLIDKIEKPRSCSRVAESAMMVFQVNAVSLAKIAKAVRLMAGVTSPHSRAGAELREAEAPIETLVLVRDKPVVKIDAMRDKYPVAHELQEAVSYLRKHRRSLHHL